MIGLRHNPYVGSFHHGINDFTRIEHNSCSNDESNSRNFESQIMSESKNNPLIGIFRHSPSQTSQKSLGLKGIIYSEKAHKPANMLSQLQVCNIFTSNWRMLYMNSNFRSLKNPDHRRKRIFWYHSVKFPVKYFPSPRVPLLRIPHYQHQTVQLKTRADQSARFV